MNSVRLAFKPDDWNLRKIQERFRAAVKDFTPNVAILTDSWNMKPRLAEAVGAVPYLWRCQALECICPLNNICLLPNSQGGYLQCDRTQLAHPETCAKCVTKHGQSSGSLHQAERQLSGVGGADYPYLLRTTVQQAAAVLVVNPSMVDLYAPFAQRVEIAPAGMDPARFPATGPIASVPPRDGQAKTILFAGLVEEYIKGFVVLHQAAERMWAKRRDFRVVVTADPPQAAWADAPYLHFVGWQSQAALPAVMRAADIVAVPALAQEALGRTAVEAMGAGRPVVASRIGGLPWVLDNGAAGLLVEPGNAMDLAAKLELLLDRPDLRAQVGKVGRLRFQRDFTWPALIERTYRPLLDGLVAETAKR